MLILLHQKIQNQGQSTIKLISTQYIHNVIMFPHLRTTDKFASLTYPCPTRVSSKHDTLLTRGGHA